MTVFTRKRALALATILGCVGAFAFASWLSSGQGPGGGQIGQLEGITVQAGVPDGSSKCLPGGTCAGYFKVSSTARNGAMTIMSIDQGANSANDTTSMPSGCPASNVSVVPQSGLSLDLPGDGTEHAYTVPAMFRLNANAPDTCAGASFTRDLVVTAKPVAP